MYPPDLAPVFAEVEAAVHALQGSLSTGILPGGVSIAVTVNDHHQRWWLRIWTAQSG